MNTIYHNGSYVPASEAKISPYDRSFLFGEGLFETFRSYDGRFPFLKAHVTRLEWSSTYMGYDLSTDLDFEEICTTLLEKNGLDNARFKMVLSGVPRDLAKATAQPIPLLDSEYETQLLIYCERLLEEHVSEPVRLKVIKNYVNDAMPLTAIKTTNYLLKMRARLVATEAGYYDGVLLNAHGMVTETCTGNLFWLDNNSTLWTVMDDQGLLSGIMRKFIIDLLKENKLNIKEGVISPKDLSHAKEIFMTNSVVG
ncbi:aminotransferase class IV, partial [bacterium]|nr:aminotransferase class IV [bacterium]MBU1917660.1 aminotransferase class IV [bacterium]